ncbi:MAG: MarR family transcriptional regulator [Planctomycetota bacterium]
MSLIDDLGARAFASRLRRISEKLMSDAGRLYKESGVDFEPRTFAVIAVLQRQDRASVTEIADELGVTHAAASQMVGALERKGWLKSAVDSKDRRRRWLALSAKGRRQIAQLEPIWEAIRLATEEILEQVRGDLLASLGELETVVESQSLFDRASERLGLMPESRSPE